MIFEEMKHPERKDAFLRRCREAVNSDPAEVEAMAAYMIENGVPQEDILMESAADRRRLVF